MELTNNTVVITGGASGLGKATAEALAKKGAKVAILDILELNMASWDLDNCIAFPCDVTDIHSVQHAFEMITSRLGTPRICINCAGIVTAERIIPRTEAYTESGSFERVIETNLIGTFNVLQIAARQMQSLPLQGEERGIIINTASIAAFEGQLGQAAYSASKGGIVSMTLPIARELAIFQIRVMTIAPGLFETPMLNKLPEKVRNSLIETTQFPKRLGYPEEYAKLVVHIIDNPMLNGTVIRLDGAVRLPPK